MKKGGTKVLIAIIIVGLAVALCTAAYMDAQERRRYFREYKDTMLSLNDSIRELRKDLALYEEEISRLNVERDNIREEIKVIFRDNEKIDTYLSNGDWSSNIKFLADFLSSEDSFSERHRGSDNQEPADKDKQVIE